MWLRLERGTRVAGVAASVMRMRSAEWIGCRVLTAGLSDSGSAHAPPVYTSGGRDFRRVSQILSIKKSMEQLVSHIIMSAYYV